MAVLKRIDPTPATMGHLLFEVGQNEDDKKECEFDDEDPISDDCKHHFDHNDDMLQWDTCSGCYHESCVVDKSTLDDPCVQWSGPACGANVVEKGCRDDEEDGGGDGDDDACDEKGRGHDDEDGLEVVGSQPRRREEDTPHSCTRVRTRMTRLSVRTRKKLIQWKIEPSHSGEPKASGMLPWRL